MPANGYLAIAGRGRRIERPVPAPGVAPAPRKSAAPWETLRQIEPAVMSRAPKAARAAAAPAAPVLDEVERAVTANVERHLDRRIGAAVRATLAADPEVARVMTDRVYDDLYDRMVLERERLR